MSDELILSLCMVCGLYGCSKGNHKKWCRSKVKMTKVDGDDDSFSESVSDYEDQIEICESDRQRKRRRVEVETAERKVKVSSVGDVSKGMDYIARAYRNRTTIIYKMIQKFVTEEFRALSTAEIKKAVGNDKIRMSNYDRWDMTHNRYCLLDRTSTGRYNLRGDVVDALNLV